MPTRRHGAHGLLPAGRDALRHARARRLYGNRPRTSDQRAGRLPGGEPARRRQDSGVFMVPFADDLVLDRYTPQRVRDEQRQAADRPRGGGGVRRHARPTPAGRVARVRVAHVLPHAPERQLHRGPLAQTATSIFLPEYTRNVDGELRSYAPDLSRLGVLGVESPLLVVEREVDDIVNKLPAALNRPVRWAALGDRPAVA